MSASAAIPPNGGTPPGAPGSPGDARRRRPWLTVAGAMAGVCGLLLVFSLLAGVVLRRWDTGLGTGFGLVPFVTADAGIVVAMLGLGAAAVIAVVAALSPSHASVGALGLAAAKSPAAPRPPAGSSDRGHLFVAAALLLGPILLFLAGLSFVTMLRRSGYPLGSGRFVDVGFIVLALLIPAGIVAALAVLVLGRGGRGTSLRTRAFFVIAVAVLIPSFCLAGFGVWAYYKSWQTAGVLYTGQASYRASQLNTEIQSLAKAPMEFTAAERASLSQAIVGQFSVNGHSAGALLGDLAAVADPNSHVLPAWAARSVKQKGYAIGTRRGPADSGRSDLSIVAWRSGPDRVYYYTDYWGDLQGIQPYAPLTRLVPIGLLGVALIAVLGILGAWILSRSVVRPVRRLAEASGRLAEGEAGVTVTPQGPRELRDLAVSFNDMNAKLTRAQETEQAFLLSVSHELKTPLTSIRGYAEGIGDGTVKPDDGAEVIGAESSRLERLVGDLLESGRMRKSAFTVRRETVDLAALAQDVARRYEGTARDAGLSLHLKTEAGGSALADNDRVLQVVSNLVENAVRCTPPPGTVTISTAPGLVTVSDTGRGLTSDDLPRAFERFYLYSRYGTDRPVGTGLGLAIVKDLTEAMGGTVSVSSAVGVGTAFAVALPQDVTSSTMALPQDVTSSTAVLPRDDAS